MAVASPIDVVTPATRKRQALAQQLQQQYTANRGGQKQLMAINHQALHAMPLFAGGGARDSVTLPAAPQPQLTVPYMQDPGVTKNLGVVNPAAPQDPNVSPSPGAGAPGPPQPGQGSVPGLGVTQSSDPNAPQAGQGSYADGSQAGGPIMDPNAVLGAFNSLPGVRRLYGPQDNLLMKMVQGYGNSLQSGQIGYF